MKSKFNEICAKEARFILQSQTPLHSAPDQLQSTPRALTTFVKIIFRVFDTPKSTQEMPTGT